MKAAQKKSMQTMVAGAARDTSHSRIVQHQKTLLGGDTVNQIEAQFKQHGRTIQAIPLKIINVDENIRQSYDAEALKALAESLKADGLIQFPTLALKKSADGYKLVCRNGHRRILAAELLGWEKIECVILPFESAKEELYHTINANLRENVFYLDIAEAYESAHNMGETDHMIAQRVGVNERTVRWYRRLMEMSPLCRSMVRAHPELFNATWAIKLARLGPLPERLEPMMRAMIELGRAVLKESDLPTADGTNATADAQATAALEKLKTQFRKRQAKAQAQWAHEFLVQLVACGFVSQRLVTKIEYEVFGEKLTDSFYAS